MIVWIHPLILTVKVLLSISTSLSVIPCPNYEGKDVSEDLLLAALASILSVLPTIVEVRKSVILQIHTICRFTQLFSLTAMQHLN